MNPGTIDVDLLRRLAIEQPESTATRILALALCTAFLVAVLVLVRRGRLREEYTPIWTVVALATMVLSVWFDALRMLTRAVGAWTPSSTLFFFGLVFLLTVSLNYAVRLSGLSLQVKLLAQEVALLRQKLAAESDAAPATSTDDARPR
jgi:magnesium-transporting ATPase (P-type)